MVQSELQKLHEFAVNLRYIGMTQSAGDYDYLVSWLASTDFNNGEHLKPNPAGENTVDSYSNNCPIPFTSSLDLIKTCTSILKAKYIVGEILNILDYLKSILTSNEESTAIESYIDYTNTLYEMLGGESTKPVVESDDPSKPLMFKSLEDGSTVKITNTMTNNTYEISYDNESWSSYNFNTDITLNTDEKVYFRCTHYTPTNNDSRYVQFVMTGKLEAYNNVNSMYSTDFASITALTQENVFYNLFGRCSALYKAPLLPATTLSKACYAGMFTSCANLVEPPALPSTTLATNCYAGMFLACTSLTKSPELPATDLVSSCYYRMFRSCTAITEICCAALNPPSGESSFVSCCNDWLYQASSSGTFYANPNAVWASNTSGIPSGWTRLPL